MAATEPRPLRWLRAHDRGLLATRRACRTAIVMPSMVALGDLVIGNPILATFAGFGSFAMLLLVDFTGPLRSRMQAEAGLALTGAVLVTLGTLASQTTWLAAVSMAVVGFAVLFAGVVSSVLAGATTSLLLAFILPVSLAGPASSIPDRLAGWGLAAAAAIPAIRFLWPAPARDPVRDGAIDACRAVAARLRAGVAFMRAGRRTEDRDGFEAAVDASSAAVQRLHDLFFATPYRPTGLSTAARAVVRLVDELKWLDSVLVRALPNERSRTDARPGDVKLAGAEVLERSADLLDAPDTSPEPLHAAVAQLTGALAELERSATLQVPVPAGDVAPEPGEGEIVSSLDPSFRAQELSFVVAQIARNVDLAAAAERRTWVDQMLGRQPAGFPGPLSAFQARAGAHVEIHSQWLRNSVRGGAALGLAVLVSKELAVSHAFWVVLAALSVLRANALATGQDVVRGLLGTSVGFVIGALLVSLIGTDSTVLWILLPPAVLLAGLAPATISFAAGQAAFTVVLLILFNILAPEGWRIGLVRVEDVAIGFGISLGVGLLFWPRGAAAALGSALAEAYEDCARYLASAVRFGLGRCDTGTPPTAAPTTEALRAAAASRRLDDTFRAFLAERGAKPAPLAEVTSLVTGVIALRLTGDAVLDLWQRDDGQGGERANACHELSGRAGAVQAWYAALAASLTRSGAVPEPLARDELADGRLVAAVAHDLRGEDGHATATAVRMIWTGDHLDAARRLGDTLAPPARALNG
jgi:uncharacterized membrane protein YccC